nr:MAG TPA: hypothetical protein [Caudoviricetes sp.]
MRLKLPKSTGLRTALYWDGIPDWRIALQARFQSCPPPTLRRWCMGGGRKCGNQGVHGSAQSVVQK